MGTAYPLISGWKQWTVTGLAAGSFLTMMLYPNIQSGEDGAFLLARLLVMPFLFLGVFVPQAVLVIAFGYLWARLSFRDISVLVLLLLVANFALGAVLGLAGLALGPVSTWVGILFFVLVGVALYFVAARIWNLPAKVALIPAVTFVVFKIGQQLLMNHVRAG